MNKYLKIIVLIILVLILCIIAGYLYISDFGRKALFSNEPRRPKIEIPVTYNIPWWTDQRALTIDSLEVNIVESNLNMLNSKSLISYKVFGHLTWKGHWQPKIKEIHISERVINDSISYNDRIIELTPIIELKQNKNLDGGANKFEFKNEHTITSIHWGINRIKFVCGNKEQIIQLQQNK